MKLRWGMVLFADGPWPYGLGAAPLRHSRGVWWAVRGKLRVANVGGARLVVVMGAVAAVGCANCAGENGAL